MDLFTATKPLRARRWFGYLAAIVSPLLALGVRFAIGDALTGYPFLTFFPAVLIAAFLGGWGPGMVATLFAGALSSYYLIEPLHSFSLGGLSGWLGLAFFVTVSAMITGLVHALSGAVLRLSAAEHDLHRTNEMLEQRVADRTRELADANASLRTEIATREAAEAQLRQSQKMEAIGQLTGGIAHDFNNMLAIVVGSLDIAKRRATRGQTDIARYIDNAMEGANRAADLTRRLLAFARQQPLAPVVIDMNYLVQGMAELLRHLIGQTVKLECVLAGGLWHTHVDPAQLESAILNLAVNARDAMPDGGQLTIETFNAFLDDAYEAIHAGVSAGQYVVVAVSDTGTGMPADVAAKAFDPFFTTKGAAQGTGLGLSQVYGFVKQSEGHVKIYTELGQGTTVRIYLRRTISQDHPGQLECHAAAKATTLKGTPEETILVVEDEDMVRRNTVESLRELGYTVRHAGSGEQALAILEEQPGIELLFTDVVMPGMTGRKLADTVRGRWADIKIIYTTGYTPNAIVHGGLLDPGVELLQKPFDIDQLARKVRKVLDRVSN